MHDRIVALYGEKVLSRSALRIRGGAGVFERVLAGKGYRAAVEIGTFRGVAAAEISQYVERVVTIDLKNGRLEQLGDAPRWDREGFWRSLGIGNVELRLVEDDQEKVRVLRQLDFEFAFIDGAHTAQSVALDFRFTRCCGRVLFHDYDRRGIPEQDQVADFVDGLPKEQVEVMDIFAYWRRPGL